jgi:hypothetical protein
MNKPPVVQQHHGVGNALPTFSATSSNVVAPPNVTSVKHEVTYANGAATRYLPGMVLIGKPEIAIKRHSGKVARPHQKGSLPANSNAALNTMAVKPINLGNNQIINQQTVWQAAAMGHTEQLQQPSVPIGIAQSSPIQSLPAATGNLLVAAPTEVPSIYKPLTAPGRVATAGMPAVPSIYRGPETIDNSHATSQSVLSNIANRICNTAQER